MSCSVPGCQNKHGKGQNISFFKFPNKDRDIVRFQMWVDQWRRNVPVTASTWEPKKYTRICSSHFDSDSWEVNPLVKHSIGFHAMYKHCNRLKKNAKPTIFNCNSSPTLSNEPATALNKTRFNPAVKCEPHVEEEESTTQKVAAIPAIFPAANKEDQQTKESSKHRVQKHRNSSKKALDRRKFELFGEVPIKKIKLADFGTDDVSKDSAFSEGVTGTTDIDSVDMILTRIKEEPVEMFGDYDRLWNSDQIYDIPLAEHSDPNASIKVETEIFTSQNREEDVLPVRLIQNYFSGSRQAITQQSQYSEVCSTPVTVPASELARDPCSSTNETWADVPKIQNGQIEEQGQEIQHKIQPQTVITEQDQEIQHEKQTQSIISNPFKVATQTEGKGSNFKVLAETSLFQSNKNATKLNGRLVSLLPTLRKPVDVPSKTPKHNIMPCYYFDGKFVHVLPGNVAQCPSFLTAKQALLIVNSKEKMGTSADVPLNTGIKDLSTMARQDSAVEAAASKLGSFCQNCHQTIALPSKTFLCSLIDTDEPSENTGAGIKTGSVKTNSAVQHAVVSTRSVNTAHLKDIYLPSVAPAQNERIICETTSQVSFFERVKPVTSCSSAMEVEYSNHAGRVIKEEPVPKHLVLNRNSLQNIIHSIQDANQTPGNLRQVAAFQRGEKQQKAQKTNARSSINRPVTVDKTHLLSKGFQKDHSYPVKLVSLFSSNNKSIETGPLSKSNRTGSKNKFIYPQLTKRWSGVDMLADTGKVLDPAKGESEPSLPYKLGEHVPCYVYNTDLVKTDELREKILFTYDRYFLKDVE